jgi:hypothetical protein
MVLGVPLFIKYKLKPSRIIVLSFLLIAFLIIPSMGQYRQILKTSSDTSKFFSRLFSEMDFKKNLSEFYSNTKSSELANAGFMIDYTYKYGDYKLGLGYWNELVFRFIPAQLLGKEFKNSLRIDESPLASSHDKSAVHNVIYVLGSTPTGIGDAFTQFDYLGSFFFFFIGLFMRRLWSTIKETESPVLQVLYAVLLIEGVVSLTHGTVFFLPGFLSAFIFLSMALWYAKTENHL